VFVHISAVEKAGYTSLADGARISYELKPGRTGKTSAYASGRRRLRGEISRTPELATCNGSAAALRPLLNSWDTEAKLLKDQATPKGLAG
jgi:hypothetical protein